MEIYHFEGNAPPRRLEAGATPPATGLVWIDWERPEAGAWEQWAENFLGVPIETKHVQDSLNPEHPSFFDGTAGYDMLIFEGLGPNDDPFPLETRVAAFFLFERVLLTVRAPDNVSFGIVKQRLLDGRAKPPDTPVLLTHLILDTMVDRFLRVRDPLSRRLTQLQEDLLDPTGKEQDWRKLLEGRRQARRLEALCDSQLEAISAWRRQCRVSCSQTEEVRIRDLSEHINRVLTYAGGEERDIEAAVQLHFSAVAHKTNRIVQTLTVISAVFLPLTLIAGIWGMNFEHMPELEWRYGYALALGVIVTVGVVLLITFRRRHLL